MAKTIFFSWQDDTPAKVGRTFLKEILEEVCAGIASDTNVDEALRNMEVDSDTQGVAGNPPVVETIFKKIDAAGVFLADMTFVGQRLDGRPTPNPNVLIEYGWALKSLKYERVICVMNEAYGKASRETLPFDLSHLRWPIRYSLSKDASKEEKAEVKRNLLTTLNLAVRTSLGTIPAQPVKKVTKSANEQLRDASSRFRHTGEELGFEDEGTRKLYLNEGPAMWLRLMPTVRPGKTWPVYELKKHAIKNNQLNLRPMARANGFDFLRAEDGMGMFAAIGRNQDLYKMSVSPSVDSVAFAFETGEVWGIDTVYLSFDNQQIPAFETIYTQCLVSYKNFLESLGIPGPYRWIAGITGVKGRTFSYREHIDNMSFKQTALCTADTIIEEGTYSEGETAEAAMEPFFKKIFDKCGIERPTQI